MSLRPSTRLSSGTFTTLSPTSRLAPPHEVTAMAEDGTNSAAWTQHHQDVADRLADLAQRVATLEARLAAAGIP